ncbi:MAG: DUF2149 domain-containing protein [Verrucomicrobiota bacterium]|nr:DUF2149 domain-containing protein [Verrucomicrobiota bacterium]
MSFLKKRRWGADSNPAAMENPLEMVANLFDMGVVFIVALFLALMAAYGVADLMSETSEVSLVKRSSDGRMEIITKKGKDISVKKITDRKIGGVEGVKLGAAYRLKNGRTVYVPE